MNLRTLKVFCDLVETSSYTKAGENNQITQSAVSQLVVSLERHFRRQFIERARRNNRPTREGVVLYEYSKQILDCLAALNSKMEEVRQSIAGDIHLATISSFGLHELPSLLERFRKAHPGVKVHVEYRCCDEVYKSVLGNEVDLDLVASPRGIDNIKVIPLRDDPMILICPPDHPLARKKRIRLKDLAGRNLVTYDTEMPTRRAVNEVLRTGGVNMGQVAELHDIEMAKRAVVVGLGIAIVPQGMVKREVANRTLSAVELSDADLRCSWAVIHRSNKIISPALRAFIDLLMEKP